jgi:uncharacterized protein
MQAKMPLRLQARRFNFTRSSSALPCQACSRRHIDRLLYVGGLFDSGLAAYLLGASPKSLREPGAPLGALLETFVTIEVSKQLSWSKAMPALSHFRDRGGAEADLILEHPDGRVVGIAVKATSTPRFDDFSGLRLLQERLQNRFAYGVLLTAAPEAVPFGRHLAPLPIETIWRTA